VSDGVKLAATFGFNTVEALLPCSAVTFELTALGDVEVIKAQLADDGGTAGQRLLEGGSQLVEEAYHPGGLFLLPASEVAGQAFELLVGAPFNVGGQARRDVGPLVDELGFGRSRGRSARAGVQSGLDGSTDVAVAAGVKLDPPGPTRRGKFPTRQHDFLVEAGAIAANDDQAGESHREESAVCDPLG
jgi:hypothetical protein